MKYRLAQIDLRRLPILLLGAALFQLVVVGSFSATAGPAGIASGIRRSVPIQHIGDRISSCKGQKGVQVNKQLLEAVIGKYRRGEPVADGIFLCREAFPTLKKYALDPDPRVRERIAYYLRLHYSTEALQLIVRQIETYPSDASAVLTFYAAGHPCYFFRKVKTRSLAQSLIARIRSRNGDEGGTEIRLLGCLSPKDLQARKFLEEMRQPTFATHLSDNDRRDQLNLVTYALAEAGASESEAKVLADIQDATATGNVGLIQSVLEKAKGFTNCRILQPLAQLILDKRGVSLDVAVNGKPGKLQARIGDLAVSAFTGALGPEVTGETDVEWKAHTDAELERVSQRVKQALTSGKFSTCRSFR